MQTRQDMPVRLGPEEVFELAALEASCFASSWSAQQFLTAFSQKGFLAFGLRENGALRCYLSCHAVLDEMEIVNLATVPWLRRQGLARRLLEGVLHVVENMGIKREYLEVRVSNAPALALYEGLGFKKVGLRKRYYPDTKEDALVMQRIAPGGE